MELNKISTIVYIYLGLYSKATCKRTPKIINGVPTSIEQFPFMAKLLNTYTDMGCAANIISEIYALTAALCTEGRQYPDDIILEVGTSYWNVQGVRHTVLNVIDHRGYNFPNNDISLLEVDQEFWFNRRVQPIAIYPRLNVPDGSIVTMAGWGRTDSYVEAQSQELMRIDVEVWPLNECIDFWYQYYTITNKMICTGRRNIIGGSCKGDSGGPLLYQGYLIGIVSGGTIDPCGVSNQPGMFHTRVASYRNWINSNAVRRRRHRGNACVAKSSYLKKSPKY